MRDSTSKYAASQPLSFASNLGTKLEGDAGLAPTSSFHAETERDPPGTSTLPFSMHSSLP
jgi:hypothetical protein